MQFSTSCTVEAQRNSDGECSQDETVHSLSPASNPDKD
jgi:hypothetical protein